MSAHIDNTKQKQGGSYPAGGRPDLAKEAAIEAAKAKPKATENKQPSTTKADDTPATPIKEKKAKKADK